MKRKFNSAFREGHKKSESGFTLIEILVAVALLAVVSIVVTSTLLNASQANDKFARGTMNESQLVDSTSLITREISLATNIIQAGDDNLVMDTLEAGLPYKEHFFMWMGSPAANPGDLGVDQAFITKYGINTTSFPKVPTLMEYKVSNGDTANPIIRTLIDGYSPGTGAEAIFKYFDAQNNQLALDATTVLVPSANLADIKRIELRFTSYITGRDLPMEMATSAVPRAGTNLGTSSPADMTSTLVTIAAPYLQGTLTPGTTTANLSWTAIAGATGYTVYRENRLQATNPEVVAVIPNGSTSTLADPGRTWGENYTYSITASGPAGVSPLSNKITLTVVPDKTRFINFNTKQAEPVANFTVARDLKNQLTWQPMNGATGYTLYRAGVQIYRGTSTTWADTGRAFGDLTTYTVLAYNAGQYGSGGNGALSDPASLISPPVAPVITGTANDTNSGATSTNTISQPAVPRALTYSYQSGAAPGTTTTQWASVSSLSANQTVAWGSTVCYANYALNDAGSSPKSNIACLNQKPGPFGILSITQTAREYYTNSLEYDGVSAQSNPGSLVGSWQAASGAANGYTVRVLLTDYRGGAGVGGTIDRSASTASTSATTTTVTPGVIYTYYVTAVAANGTLRTTSKTVQTQPDVPQSGEVYITCSNFSNGYQYMNYAYNSNTYPRYGGADYTQRRQFAQNNQTAYGSGLDNNLTVGWSSAITGSDTSSGMYTSGFTLQNFLNITADYGDASSAVMKAYGTYHHLGFDGANWYEAGGNTATGTAFSGCGGPGNFVEPSNPCYGYTAATFYAGCTYGTGRPKWTTQ